MTRFILALAIAIGLAAPATAQVQQIDSSEIAGKAIAFFIREYDEVAAAAEIQAARTADLCEAPGQAQLQAARAQFPALVTAWSRIEAVRFGPVLTDNRLERILFWPDRKSVGLKQVQAALATLDETVTDPESLKIKSVALQGLTALEYVLYGTGANDLLTAEGAHRCAFALAIAQRIAATAAATADDWRDPQGIAMRLTRPVPENFDYRTDREVLQEITGIFIHGTELMRDTRIKPFLGDTPEKTNYRLALFWRSGLTIASLAANVAGLRDLFVESGLDALIEGTANRANDSFRFELANFTRTAADIAVPLQEALADDSLRSKIGYLLILTQSLQTIAVQQIAYELGLSVGFSALDGD